MPRVFISYIRENTEEVQRLYDALTEHGVKVWLDRNSIMPGTRWKQAIHGAIRHGDFFIACFSRQYNKRDKAYMNEELAIAIDELRKYSSRRAWFIPVKLSECEIPDLSIGAGETLQDIQWVNLYESWEAGIQYILSAIKSVRDLFISYDNEDRLWVEWIAWQLKEAGYTLDLSAWDSRSRSDFMVEMQKGATSTKGTVVALSQWSLAALYAQPRLANAFAQALEKKEKRLVFVRVGECNFDYYDK